MFLQDAHNCILDFDDDVSFFAVYDGHGGSEVAVYTSQELPTFLKTTDKYKNGLYKEALIDAFLGFDDTIPSTEVLDKLKDIRDQELMESRGINLMFANFIAFLELTATLQFYCNVGLDH